MGSQYQRCKMKIGIILLALLLFGCAREIDDGKLNVVTTTGMIADIAKNVGEDDVTVQSLMGAGVDPHLYKASESDVRKISQADIIFYNGLHLEAKMGEVLENIKGKTYAVTDSIPKDKLLAPEAFKGFHDPHVWFDVSMWKDATITVRDALSEKDPANKEKYFSRAEKYMDSLDELNEYVKQKAAQVPKDQRVLVTAHDAFNYFGRAYGFEVVGLQGISTEAQAGTQDVQNIAKFVADNKIKAIFVESSVPERNIQAVKEAVKAKGWDVKIGGSLYSDAMGSEGTVEGTYAGMVRHNINTIAEALK